MGAYVQAMIDTPSGSLRTGWTTGACATAAARAAAEKLLLGHFPDPVTISLPKGEEPSFQLVHQATGNDWAEAGVEKDAGDDPDVTHGATIIARVALRDAFSGIIFHAGDGVGVVTKPGLPIAPGEPAINPVPRQMITEALEYVAQCANATCGFEVTISVPGGTEIAKKTWNPRLGIKGGLSILGTTGIVRPFSCSAWIASIHRGVDVARATGLTHVVGATGSSSENAVRRLYPALPETAYLDMGDFAGGLLKYLRRHPVPRLTVAGGIGKMTKLAQGALDLHSKRSQVDFVLLSEMAAGIGADTSKVTAANTALEALEIAGPALAVAVAQGARNNVEKTLQGSDISIEIIVTNRSGDIQARLEFEP